MSAFCLLNCSRMNNPSRSYSARLLLSLLAFAVLASAGFAQNLHLKNGWIWDGEAMVQRDLFITGPVFGAEAPARIDSIIDLEGKYVLPPFGDFHTHLFDGDYSVAFDSMFLAQGVFYAHDLCNDPFGREQMADYFGQARTVDVAYANGCLTSNYGHPIEGYERTEFGGRWNLTDEERAQLRESRVYADRTYYIVDNAADVEAKMDLLLRTEPDVVKVILFDSEEYAASEEVPLYNKGLDPALLPRILERADAAGLRVVAHVESEYDLCVAMAAGIRYFAHLPYYGFGNDGRVPDHLPGLQDSTWTMMRDLGVKVNPTLSRTFGNLMYIPEQYRPDSSDLEAIKGFHREMLAGLKQNGVPILAGADFYNNSALDELLYYEGLDVFSPAELIGILVSTGREVFPLRKVGALEAGCEASCLVLEGDPTVDFKEVKRICLRIKAGQILD